MRSMLQSLKKHVAVVDDIEYHSRRKMLNLESSTENTKLWTQLKTFNITLPIGPPLTINNNEFIVAPEIYPYMRQIDSLYKFKSDENPKKAAWDKKGFIKYPVATTRDHTMAFDKDKNILYIQNRENYIMRFDLTSKESKAMQANKKHNVLNTYVSASGVIINGTFNIIGGLRNNLHMIWDDKLEKFSGIKYHQFKEFKTGFYGHTVAYIGKARFNKNILLLFGGIDAINGERLNSIYRFDGNQNSWNKLELELPVKIAFMTSVVTQNERYVILCGGEIGSSAHTDCIYIYDIDRNKLFESQIKCPNARSKYGACILSDYSSFEAELLAAGYLRQCMKLTDFPLDIVFILKLLINKEYLHIIQLDRGKHWRILVADILSHLIPINTK